MATMNPSSRKPSITPRQLVEVAMMPPTAKRKGMVEALRRNYRLETAQRRLLDGLQAQEVMPAARTIYRHPAHASPAAGVGEELSEADLIWLQRLPTDPSEVSWEDARRLATMAARVKDHSHKVLVRSIWRPIADHHDRALAETELANAKVADPEIPSGLPVASAIGEAIRAENATLKPHEAEDRAHELLAIARADAARQRTSAIDDAERTVRRLEIEQAERSATTRTELVRHA
jgi:hypothetical protein